MFKKFFLLVVLGVLVSLFIAKSSNVDSSYFRSPIDFPIYLSGNFGELRTGHYHSGLDIKTRGVRGKNIYASAGGYISRIKVSPVGYGKALYIDHPNGYTTVYAHLDRFEKKIDSLVMSWQYEKKSFAIDTMLAANEILVSKGEIIALSGNSGSSGGPHLHFEIRHTDTEKPVNPLLFGIAVADTKPPRIRRLYIYPLEDKALINGINKPISVDVKYYKSRFFIPKSTILKLSGKIGFGLDTRDYMNFTKNYYGIYDFVLKVDDNVKHHFTFDTISFDDSKFINAHIDFNLFKKTHQRIHKCFHEPNHQESFVNKLNKGIVFNDKKRHSVNITVSDVRGNKSSLSFFVESVPVQNKNEKNVAPDLLFSVANRKIQGRFFLEIPSFALFRNYSTLKIDSVKSLHSLACSKEYMLKGKAIPLCKTAKVGIILPHSARQKDKMYVAQKSKRKYHYIGNEWNGDTILGRTKEIGVFVVLKDTVPPVVQQLKSLRYPRVGFKIKDNLSGISTYEAMVNGKWQPFEYDPKYHLYSFDLSRAKNKGNNPYIVQVRVEDNCGNISKKQIILNSEL